MAHPATRTPFELEVVNLPPADFAQLPQPLQELLDRLFALAMAEDAAPAEAAL